MNDKETLVAGLFAVPAFFARFTRQTDGEYLVEFPDLPGCLTEGKTIEEATVAAKEALSGWLYVALKHGDNIPTPSVFHGRGYRPISPDANVSVPLVILWSRRRRGLTQSQVAHAMGISQQAYRKYEVPGQSNPTVGVLERIAEVTGLVVTFKVA
jgi:predicted RNase H-like HicB family nuclease/DNA-binding XRE family transcriptional regulator